jgi:hypothetical protein
MSTFAVVHKAVGKLLVGGKNHLLVSLYITSLKLLVCRKYSVSFDLITGNMEFISSDDICFKR